MASFISEEVAVCGSRLGKILRFGTQNGLNIATPTCTIYTRHGHVPHLTHDLIQSLNLFPEPVIYQLTLPTLLNDTKIVSQYGKGIKSYVGLPESALVYLSFHDPAKPIIMDAHSRIGAFLTTKDGRCLVDSNRYLDVLKAFPDVDVLQPICDSATPADAAAKRLQKSVENTARFTKQCLESLDNVFDEAEGQAAP